jgi:hypothetical protein
MHCLCNLLVQYHNFLWIACGLLISPYYHGSAGYLSEQEIRLLFCFYWQTDFFSILFTRPDSQLSCCTHYWLPLKSNISSFSAQTVHAWSQFYSKSYKCQLYYLPTASNLMLCMNIELQCRVYSAWVGNPQEIMVP